MATCTLHSDSLSHKYLHHLNIYFLPRLGFLPALPNLWVSKLVADTTCGLGIIGGKMRLETVEQKASGQTFVGSDVNLNCIRVCKGKNIMWLSFKNMALYILTYQAKYTVI